jgi:hypothetical protein
MATSPSERPDQIGYTLADASNLFDLSFERPNLIECRSKMHARRYWMSGGS